MKKRREVAPYLFCSHIKPTEEETIPLAEEALFNISHESLSAAGERRARGLEGPAAVLPGPIVSL